MRNVVTQDDMKDATDRSRRITSCLLMLFVCKTRGKLDIIIFNLAILTLDKSEEARRANYHCESTKKQVIQAFPLSPSAAATAGLTFLSFV